MPTSAANLDKYSLIIFKHLLVYLTLLNVFFRGFSYVDLVTNSRTHKSYALKRVLCHSQQDEKRFLNEVEYMKLFRDHPNIISLEGSEVVPVKNPTSSAVSKIHILMPYYSVSISLQWRYS